jgi:hypothetical protein
VAVVGNGGDATAGNGGDGGEGDDVVGGWIGESCAKEVVV